MTGAGAPPVIDAARTAAELLAKLTGLDSELDAWRAATSGEDAPLLRHHTQISAVAGTLKQASADLAKPAHRRRPGTLDPGPRRLRRPPDHGPAPAVGLLPQPSSPCGTCPGSRRRSSRRTT